MQQHEDICFAHTNPEIMQNVIEEMPNSANMQKLSDFFKVFGDMTRLRMLIMLSHGEFCVDDLSRALGLNQSVVSHALRVLKRFEFVRFRRVGKHTMYSIGDDHISSILSQGLEHIDGK